MEEYKKVSAEVMGPKKEKKHKKTIRKIKKILLKIKLTIAIILDLIDFLIGWIPVVNTLFDIVTFVVLLITLKNKKLAFLSLIELPLIGLPPFSIIDMFLPIATILTLMDLEEGSFSVYKQTY